LPTGVVGSGKPILVHAPDIGQDSPPPAFLSRHHQKLAAALLRSAGQAGEHESVDAGKTGNSSHQSSIGEL